MSSRFLGSFIQYDYENEEEIEDIDAEDRDDPQFVTDYVMEIFDYLKQTELVEKIPDNYMDTQNVIRPKHRNDLVKWIGEAYLRLQLTSETLFLAVSLLDKVLSSRVVSKEKLHLVGVSCLFIASKYEENSCPPLSDFRYCANNSFSAEEIIEMERVLLLKVLDFNMNLINPLMFLRRQSKAARSDTETHTLSKYICESSLSSYDMLNYLPSMISASSVYLARKVLGKYPFWSPTLVYYTDYHEEDLQECVAALQGNMMIESKGNGAIYRKYCDIRLHSVAKIHITS